MCSSTSSLGTLRQTGFRSTRGAIDAGAGVVWVMHRPDPTMLRIDPRQDPPVVREFLLPLPIEEPSGDFTRRVHTTDNGCWIVGMHDVHRVVVDGDDAVTVERVCVGGGMPSVVVDGQIYVFGSTSDRLVADQRYGMIRRPADAVALWVCDPATQSLREVNDRQTVFEVRKRGRRPDMVTDADGVQCGCRGAAASCAAGGETTVVDVGDAEVWTAVWVQPRPEDDPATAALLADITVGAWFVHAPGADDDPEPALLDMTAGEHGPPSTPPCLISMAARSLTAAIHRGSPLAL